MFTRLTKEQKIAAKAIDSVRCSAIVAVTDRPERFQFSNVPAMSNCFTKLIFAG